MNAEAFLTTSAEVGIGIAGFAGIAAVLGHRGPGAWGRPNVFRMRVLLRGSFVVVLMSLLPLALFPTTLSEPAVWTIASSVFIAFFAVSAFFDVAFLRAAVADREELSRGATIFATMFFLTSVSLNLVNVALLRTAWPFLFALILHLTMAFVQFVRIIRTLWQWEEDDSG